MWERKLRRGDVCSHSSELRYPTLKPTITAFTPFSVVTVYTNYHKYMSVYEKSSHLLRSIA